MYISRQLKQQNIAEYLLYMWQVEDMIRANGFDRDNIRKNIIEAAPSLDEGQRRELAQWYDDLMEMMRREDVTERGHIQLNKNVILWLTDLHLRLLRSPKFPYYSAAYYKALPFIVELRAKGADKSLPEVETAFDALYGVLLLRLRKKEISAATQQAVKQIGDWIALLAGYYQKDKEDRLEFE